MKELCWNYESGILQVMSSIRSYLGISTYYEEDEDVSKWLNDNQFNKVFVILIDAMGEAILKKHEAYCPYFLSHMEKSVDTVFPTTTTAATTSVLTGKSPKENGWIGWIQKFEEDNDYIIPFLNKSFYGDAYYSDTYIDRKVPILKFYDELNLKEEGTGDYYFPSWSKHNPCDSFEDMMNRMIDVSHDEKIKGCYFYHDRLDTLMHEIGTNDIKVSEHIQYLETTLKEAVKHLPSDVGVVVIADHGQVDVTPIEFEKDEVFMSCIKGYPWIDARCWSVDIKEGMKDIFVSHMLQTYGDQLDLYSHDEVLHSSLFGPIDAYNHPVYMNQIGDYVMIANGDKTFNFNQPYIQLGSHSGSCDDERKIPVILLKNEENYEK